MTDPNSYEAALALGFKPVKDPDALTEQKSKFAVETGFSCATAPVGTKCFDWTDDQGVRTICFCTAAKTCGNCLQK